MNLPSCGHARHLVSGALFCQPLCLLHAAGHEPKTQGRFNKQSELCVAVLPKLLVASAFWVGAWPWHFAS